jgi:hypothetical protein
MRKDHHMQLPTEGEITSQRPVIGKLVVAYKKFVGLFIAPYLRTVFQKEHQIIEERFRAIDAKLFTATQDLLKRTDALIVTIDKRIENVMLRGQHIAKDLHAIKEQQRTLEQRFDKAIMQHDLCDRVGDISREISCQNKMLELILLELRTIVQVDTESKKIAP